jgi:cellulose synthase/poly-beta-1,6-N-acetylglucosamine synthase-like glycosyltransferase
MMKWWFWSSFGMVGFVYFIYPLIILSIAKAKGAKIKKENITPPITLIFPLHNEENVIRDRVDNALALDYPQDKLEIIFALDSCTDHTREIISEYRDPRIKVLEFNGRAGKVATLNKAVPAAKGEIIVFSDANSIHKNDTLTKLMRDFADEKVGCACGKLVYIESEHTLVSKGENLYWKYEHFIKKQESRLGRLLITNGSLQAVRKELYPFPDPEVADDLSIPILIRAKGYKVVYEPKAMVYEVATQSVKEEFNQKVRIISQGFKGTVKLHREILSLGLFGVFQFFVHKLLRWLIFLFLISVFCANLFLLHEQFYAFTFAAQIIFYGFALIGFLLRQKYKIKIFYIPFYFCLVNFASIVALNKFFIQGETRIWEKAYSTRVRR